MSELRMPAMNQITVAGRLVQDPEFRLIESGVARLSGRLAVNRSFRDREGDWQEEASIFNFRRLASTSGTSCRSVGQGISGTAQRETSQPQLAG